MNFLELIGEELTKTLENQGITVPTPIQQRAIPLILKGKDLAARSATGTGKTLAYLLPIFAEMDAETKAAQAIIVAPTYELASQITKEAKALAKDPTDVAMIIGSATKARQIEMLKNKPKLIVCTVQRVLKYIEDKKLSVHHVRTIVFDEADHLFVHANLELIAKLIKATRGQRQILLFSASLPPKTLQTAAAFMKEDYVSVSIEERMPENIRHYYTLVYDARDKMEILRRFIRAVPVPQAIVFVNAPFLIRNVDERLNFHKIPSSPLFSATDKNKRKKSIDAFREGRVKILVASDLGSRGLNMPDLAYVINFDLPGKYPDYLHRAGRCGRMAKEGYVLSIITPNEKVSLDKIADKLGLHIPEIIVSHGKLTLKDYL